MGPFLLRRIVNYLVLITLATCLGYLLAAASLSPRSYFEQRQPPPRASAVNATLTQLNLNDHTPLEDRFAHWAEGASAEIDSLFTQALSSLDRTQAIAYANQADAAIWKLDTIVPLFLRPQIVATKATLANYGAPSVQDTIYENLGFVSGS